MNTWAIGDVQGCHDELVALLDDLALGAGDRLWFVGDLVNRGPASLATLRLVKSLGKRAVVVLGNHDLHWLAIYFGGHKAKRADTFDELANAPDVEALSHWLRVQPLVYRDEDIGFTLVHAGIYPRWSSLELSRYATEVELVLEGNDYVQFLRELYGNEPERWEESLTGMSRLRFITNCCTRMRFLDSTDGLDFLHKEELVEAPAHLSPWFDIYARRHPDERVVFGHWASIQGVTGHPNLLATDTGCVWGRTLTAVHLGTGERRTVLSRQGRQSA